jgi:Na+-driven multidrug efflux pump
MSATAAAPPTTLDPAVPTWRRVVALAWPNLAQQFLILLVGVSDQYLAGHLRPPPGVSHASFQASLTTANSLAWFLTSYLVLISVGTTAFVGGGPGRRPVCCT